MSDEQEVEKVAEAIYLSFFLPPWPPTDAVEFGMDADDFRRAARNVLLVQLGYTPDYDA